MVKLNVYFGLKSLSSKKNGRPPLQIQTWHANVMKNNMLNITQTMRDVDSMYPNNPDQIIQMSQRYWGGVLAATREQSTSNDPTIQYSSSQQYPNATAREVLVGITIYNIILYSRSAYVQNI